MSKHGVETCCYHPGLRYQKCAFCWQSDVDGVLGLHLAHPQALPGLWQTVNGAKYPLLAVNRVMLINGVVLRYDDTQHCAAAASTEMT
jgi:hypothetical protein